MTLAIFDLDNTLLEGDSEWLWSIFLLKQGVVDEVFTTQIDSYFRDYEAGRLDFNAYECFLLAPHAQLSSQKLEELVVTYLHEVIRPHMRLWMLDRVAWHRNQGHTLLLITACNALLAEPIAQLLQFSNLICTKIENGQPVGIPAFRSGKVTLLQAWLTQHALGLANSWVYSDSHNDLPLMQQVSHPIAVRPDAVLRSHAILSGWEIL